MRSEKVDLANTGISGYIYRFMFTKGDTYFGPSFLPQMCHLQHVVTAEERSVPFTQNI